MLALIIGIAPATTACRQTRGEDLPATGQTENTDEQSPEDEQVQFPAATDAIVTGARWYDTAGHAELHGSTGQRSRCRPPLGSFQVCRFIQNVL